MVEPPVQHRGWAADLIWRRAQNLIQVRVDSRETARGTARIDDRGEPAVRRLPPFDLHARRSQQWLSPPLCIDPGALDFIGERSPRFGVPMSTISQPRRICRGSTANRRSLRPERPGRARRPPRDRCQSRRFGSAGRLRVDPGSRQGMVGKTSACAFLNLLLGCGSGEPRVGLGLRTCESTPDANAPRSTRVCCRCRRRQPTRSALRCRGRTDLRRCPKKSSGGRFHRAYRD